jgi:hypothetical protein
VSKLWVPPRVSDEHLESTRAYNASLLQMFEFDLPLCDTWNPVLRSIDPLLRIGKARERAHAVGVRPGFWHLLRLNDTGPYSVTTIHVNGQYAEPTQSMLDALRDMDLQNNRVIADQRRQREAEARAKERERERDTEERLEEMQDRWNAVTRAQVSMNDATPWTQNASGRKPKKD